MLIPINVSTHAAGLIASLVNAQAIEAAIYHKIFFLAKPTKSPFIFKKLYCGFNPRGELDIWGIDLLGL